MVLADSSAWIEYLRDTGSPACELVDASLESGIAICDPVRMELLVGARSPRHLRELQGLLGRAVHVPTESAHYDEAAALYRACRAAGETVRKMLDCLIAAHAISADLELLQSDGDFEVLARHSELRLARL